MYLLYLDESGNESDPADKHFVLAGAAVFEQTTFFLGKRLDDLQAKHFPGLPPVAFHASEIRSGRGFWRKVEEKKGSSGFRVGRRPEAWRQEAGDLGSAGARSGRDGGMAGGQHGRRRPRMERPWAGPTAPSGHGLPEPSPTDRARAQRRFQLRRGTTHPHRTRKSQKKKQDVISEISQIIAQAGQGMVLFGAVIEKTDKLWGEAARRPSSSQSG